MRRPRGASWEGVWAGDGGWPHLLLALVEQHALRDVVRNHLQLLFLQVALPKLVHQEAPDGPMPRSRVCVLLACDERHHALRPHSVDRVCPRQGPNT